MAEYEKDKDHVPDDARFETLAIHGGQHPEPVTGAVMPPIFQTSTYAQAGPGEHTGFEYTRTHNPTRYALERALASLERGRYGLVFGSGCAATMTVVTHDTAAGRMAAIRLDPERGFKVRWRRDITALAFSALVGGAKHREIVIPDSGTDGDEVVWLSERRGRELARSQPLAVAPAPGNIVTPGFDGRYYYVSSEGKLWELRPSAP